MELRAENEIRFDDGAAYERTMGVWSRLVGETFIDWLCAPAGWRWIDIGCGNGAFTELLVQRCAPSEVRGVDPSEGQLAYARTRSAARSAGFSSGDAMALPFPAEHFDAAVMALVLVFVPDPGKAMSEMLRVVRPGGSVATYVWDTLGGGFPLEPVLAEMRAMGLPYPSPMQVGMSRIDALLELWLGAAVRAVQTREITVHRKFADFDDFWTAALGAPQIGPSVGALPIADARKLKERVRMRLSVDDAEPITIRARANAIKGRVPG